MLSEQKLLIHEVMSHDGEYSLGLGESSVQKDYFIIKMNLIMMDIQLMFISKKSLLQTVYLSGLLLRNLQIKVLYLHYFHASGTK